MSMTSIARARPTGTVPPTHVPGRGRSPRRRDVRMLAAVPALVWFAAFTIGPLVSVFWISLLDWPGLIAPAHYTGLANFRTVVTDPVFAEAARNTALQLLVVLPVMIPAAFMLGYHLTTRPRGHDVLRVVLFTPALISLSVKALIFFAVFAPDGMLNGALDLLGLDGLRQPWLANEHTALWTVVAVDLWSGIGFTAVLFAARLASVPAELAEAARLDGAGTWRLMWSVLFPIIREFVAVTTMLQFLWILFTSAGTVLLLTNGGPGSSSTTLSFLIYDKAFAQSDLGYSQAAAVLLLVAGLLGMGLIYRLLSPSRREER